MKQEYIKQGMAEIYHYNCHECGQGNLSRDEVTELPAKSGRYLCFTCFIIKTPTDICPCPDCRERKNRGKSKKSNVVDTK